MTKVLLIGGSGFIGRRVAAHLDAAGMRVTVPTRRPQNARTLLLLPQTEVVPADIGDDRQLRGLLRDADAVVNLVGVLHSRPGQPWGPAFEAAHVDLPRRLVGACDALGIARLVHVSALGAAADAPSEYLRSKAAGEDAVRAGATPWTILRPSVVFGPEDRFLNLFAGLLKCFPVLPLGGARARMQPVYVGDVAQAVLDCLQRKEARGHTFEVAGPTVYTLSELITYVAEVQRRRRGVVALPAGLARLQAAVLECLPGPLMSRDNLRSLQVHNVASGEPLPFGRRPTALEAVAPDWLRPRY